MRPEFPALDQEANGRPLVYFDSGATSQKPRWVLETERCYYERDNANVHRGAHLLATRATEAYERAREKVAAFVNAESTREVVFTSGATEALNLVSHCLPLREGDEVVLTVMEHHANIVPWQLLASRTGVALKFAKLNADKSNVDEDHLRSLVTPKTKLIAMAHVSNVLGCEAPVSLAASLARSVGAAVLLDACQSVPHMKVDVQALGVDFIAASGHKMLGPTGIGFLWGRRELLDAMPPFKGGGEMIDQVTIDRGTTFAGAPTKFEAGTPPIAQAVALGSAIDFLTDVGLDEIRSYEGHLAAYLLDGLQRRRNDITIYGNVENRAVALVAFNIDGVHASDLAFFLDQEGVAVRAGHHCTQPLHHELGIDAGSCRASLALYNTIDEIDRFLDALDTSVDFLKNAKNDDLLLSG
mmetsp:Transcript_13202/g.43029  ORF Transcript_13202/g.43029 Transcript_13202/m.43029 type:complete len:413 (+) Transcript_13202:206-1444(+)